MSLKSQNVPSTIPRPSEQLKTLGMILKVTKLSLCSVNISQAVHVLWNLYSSLD